MSNKKRNCQAQNYQCGGTCIQGVEVCHVNGLTPQSNRVGAKLLELIDLTRPEGYKKKKTSGIDLTRPEGYKLGNKSKKEAKSIIDLIDLTRPEGYKKKKNSETDLDLSNDTNPKRVIDNGKKLVEKFIDKEILGNSTNGNIKENFEKAEKISENISELEWDIELLESNVFIYGDVEDKKELKNLEEKRDKLTKEYNSLIGKDSEKKTISEKDSESFQNLLNSLSGNFNEDNIIIDSDTITGERVERVKKNAGDAFSLLGLNSNVKFLEDNPRAYAESGINFSTKSKTHKVFQRKGEEAAKQFASEEYKKAGRGKVNLGKSSSPEEDRTNTFHELGHHLEFSNSSIGDIHAEFIKSRSTTGEIKELSEITGNSSYGFDEKAYEGAYISPYVGKVYEKDTYEPLNTTESFSMGFERFSSPQKMLELFNKDPEYFYLIVGTIVEAKK